MSRKVCVIGLDCAAPELIFDRWADQLPNLRRVMESGVYGSLESVIPPITVPAWMCMVTGQDPGTLGIYGFRNRRDHTYDGLAFANSRMIHEATLWDILARSGKKTIALGVPLTYPPRPINGLLITDFLAPDTQSDYTFPSELKEEISDVVGDYILDTREFRTEDKARLLAEIYAMTRQRFKLARHLIASKPWDLFFMVDMGPDRLHHAFWKFFDPQHPRHVAGNPFENAMRDYYIALDSEVGALLDCLDPDTRVLIVSDHGAKRMEGGICFNDWLIQEGYLVLKEPVAGATKFSPALVDWSRTRAWGDGGYYGRLFLNIVGREPEGVVALEEVEALTTELTRKLEAMVDPTGRPLGNRIFRPNRLYKQCRNVAPDLIVYFGDLYWRSVGSVGNSGLWTDENDTGPDDANHAQYGIFLMAEVAQCRQRHNSGSGYVNHRREGLSLLDVAPTVLDAFGIVPPAGMGRNVVSTEAGDVEVYSEAEEAELARRLEDLGYL